MSITCHIQKHTFICRLSLSVTGRSVDRACLPPSFNFEIPLNWRDDKLCWLKLNIKKSSDVAATATATAAGAFVVVIKQSFRKTQWINETTDERTTERTREKNWRKIPSNTYTFKQQNVYRYSQSAVWKVDTIWTERHTKNTIWKLFFPFVPFAWKWAEATSSNLKQKKRSLWRRRNMKIAHVHIHIHTNTHISAGRIFDKQIDTSARMKIKWRKCQRFLENLTVFVSCHIPVDDIPSWWNWTQNRWNGERERELVVHWFYYHLK